MVVKELIDILKKSNAKKGISFRTKGMERKLYPEYYVESEALYLFTEGDDISGGILTTSILKDFLEYENTDDCWSHAIFRDDVSRFEDCEVFIVNGSKESLDDYTCGGVYSLSSDNILESEDGIILVDSEYKEASEPEDDTVYYVTFKVDSRYIVKIKAKDIDDAKAKAILAYQSADFGEAEVLDGIVVIVEDTNGNYVWEK